MHGDTALLVPQGDPIAVADTIEALQVDAEHRARIGEAGRALAVETASWNARASALVDELSRRGLFRSRVDEAQPGGSTR
jgi:glycosyltransferase involved in cell wall biosynthesis